MTLTSKILYRAFKNVFPRCRPGHEAGPPEQLPTLTHCHVDPRLALIYAASCLGNL